MVDSSAEPSDQIKSIQPQSQDKYVCLTWGCSSVQRDMLLSHITSYAVEASKCQVCNKIFNNAAMLETHMIQHTGVHPYQCQICHTPFEFKSLLEEHNKLEHENMSQNEPLIGVITEKYDTNIPSTFKEVKATSRRRTEKKELCFICGKWYMYVQLHIRTVHATSRLKTFLCPHCPRTYYTANELRIHSRTHTGIRNFVCEVCGSTFYRSVHLKRHINSIHTNPPNSFQCDICQHTFNHKRSMQRHIEHVHVGIQRKYKMYSCPECGQRFLSETLRYEHMMVIHAGKVPYLCNCGENFNRKATYLQHNCDLRSVSIESKLYSCYMCKEKLPNLFDLEAHWKVAHGKSVECANKDKVKFKCPLTSCGESFSTATEMRKHRMSHVNSGRRIQSPKNCNYCNSSSHTLHTGEKKLSCDICGKMFRLKCGLRHHILTHTGTKTVTCQTCGRHFLTKQQLVSHLRVHTGENPFPCDICGRRFTHRSSMKTHKSNVHNPVKEPATKYPCTVCNKELSSVSNLAQHMSIHSGEKSFTCQLCSKSFRLMSGLQTHMGTHSDLKPIGCPVCNRHFRKKQHLDTHMRTHTGEKPYSCEICGRAFSQAGDRNKHRRNMHRQQTSTFPE